MRARDVSICVGAACMRHGAATLQNLQCYEVGAAWSMSETRSLLGGFVGKQGRNTGELLWQRGWGALKQADGKALWGE